MFPLCFRNSVAMGPLKDNVITWGRTQKSLGGGGSSLLNFVRGIEMMINLGVRYSSKYLLSYTGSSVAYARKQNAFYEIIRIRLGTYLSTYSLRTEQKLPHAIYFNKMIIFRVLDQVYLLLINICLKPMFTLLIRV